MHTVDAGGARSVASTDARAAWPLLSAHPGKRATERFWLLYTPVWAALAAVVMMGGFAEHWGDLPLLLFGVGLALPALLGPLLLRVPEEAHLPLFARAGVKLSCTVSAFALLLNYSQTPFFFDVLHMHYGFRSTVNIRNNPLFLYFLTIAYFATYAVLLLMAYRGSMRLFARAPRFVRLCGAVLACVVVAGLESALNANPFTTRLFCYDDMTFVLWFGSIAYGLAFLCVLPVWLGVDEHPGDTKPLGLLLVGVLAAVYVDTLLLDLLRHHVAPHFTVVHTGAIGLGDFATSCLGAR
jgi:cycloeucalenol cycloisomerase